MKTFKLNWQKRLKKNLSARQVEQLVKKYKGESKPIQKTKKRTHPLNLMKKLSEFLESRVQLRHNDKNGSGKIIIDYFNLDDLERLERLFRKNKSSKQLTRCAFFKILFK